MKRFLKLSLTLLVVVTLVFTSVVTSFAAGKLSVNGAKAPIGSVVTYDLQLGDCTEDVIGFQMQVIFDNEYLEVDKNSVEFPNVTGVVSNAGDDGVISFNFTDINNPAIFTEMQTLVKSDFKVLKEGKTEITYFVTELYGDKAFAEKAEDVKPYLEGYTFKCNLLVDGKEKVKGETPVVFQDQEQILQGNYQGDFINYADGKGESNADNTDESRVAVTGATQTQVVHNQTNSNSQNNNSDPYRILIIVAVVLVIGAVIILIILKNKKPAINNDDADATEENTVSSDDNTEE